MDLVEYYGKQILHEYDIKIPKSYLIINENELIDLENSISYPVVIKAQVPLGGRGKNGGILFCENKDELYEQYNLLKNKTIKGYPVIYVIVEKRLDILQEFYISLTINYDNCSYLLIISDKGGQDIEDTALAQPEHISITNINPIYGLFPFQIRHALLKYKLSNEVYEEFEHYLLKLYKMFTEINAELVEINPFVVTPDNLIIAADAKVSIDDGTLYKLPKNIKKIIKSQNVIKYKSESIGDSLKEIGVEFIKLDGDIGMISIGAGLALAIIDWIRSEGANPHSFIDITPGMINNSKNQDKGVHFFEVLIDFFNKQDDIKQVFYNVIAGGADVSIIGKLFIEANKKSKLNKPLTVYTGGNSGQKARGIFKEEEFDVFDTLSGAVNNIIKIAKGEKHEHINR